MRLLLCRQGFLMCLLLVGFVFGANIKVFDRNDRLIDSFQVDPTGTNFSTSGFRNAFNKATPKGSKVVVPEGTFKVSQLIIKPQNRGDYDNLKVELDSNCVIFMSEDSNDYINDIEYDAFVAGEHKSSVSEIEYFRDTRIRQRSLYFIYFKNIDGLTISGRGTIIGNVRTSALTHGTHKKNPYFDWTSNWSKLIKTQKINGKANEYVYKATLLKIRNCKNVYVKDIRLHYSSYWAFRTIECNMVTIDRVTVQCMPFGHSDGIDIVSSKNVTVSNCYVSSGDDAICIKSSTYNTKPCKNVTITDCVMKSPTNGFKIGTATQSEIKNIRVVNCTIDVPDPIIQKQDSASIDGTVELDSSQNYTPPFSGITIECVDGGAVTDIFVDSIKVLNAKAPIAIMLNRRNERNDKNKRAVGTLSNIKISNLTAKLQNDFSSRDQQIATIITGIPGQRIKDVHLDNISIETKGSVTDLNKVFEVENVPEKETFYPENIHYRHIHKDTTIIDKRTNKLKDTVLYKSKDPKNLNYLPGYGFFVRHVDGFTMNNVVITVEGNDIRPPVVLSDVQNVSINPRKFVPIKDGLSTLLVSKFETTELEYRALMSENRINVKYDLDNKQSNYPMVNVSWYDVIEYCNRRSESEGLEKVYSYNGGFSSDGSTMSNVRSDLTKNGYRLPTKEEWEYLYFGGVSKRTYRGFFFDAKLESLGEYSWYEMNSDGIAHPVGLKKANNWGLYDMAGNVFEWLHYDGDEAHIRGGAYDVNDLTYFKGNRGKVGLQAKQHFSQNLGFRLVRNAPNDTLHSN